VNIENWDQLQDFLLIQVSNILKFINKVKNISLPVVWRYEDNSIGFVWDNNKQYIDVDFMKGGKYEWFAKNRLTEEVFGTEEDPESELPKQFYDFLNTYFAKE
jgi:hypothetical protein